VKNIIKFLGIIAITAIIGVSLVTCDDGSESDDNGSKSSGGKTLVSIAVTTTKTYYNLGEELNKADIVVTANYSDGTNQPVAAKDYTINGFDSLTEGEKTVTVSYKGKKITFTVTVRDGTNNQTPAAGDFTVSGLSHIFDGNPKTVTITRNQGKSTGTITIYYSGIKTAPSAIGSYPVTFDVEAAEGWNAATNLSAGTMVIANQTANSKTPVAADFNIGNLSQTAGSVTAVTIEPREGKSEGQITIYYNNTTTIPQTAGTYTVTFNVAAAYGWNAATSLNAGTLTISAKNFTIDEISEQTYNGSAITPTVTVKDDTTTLTLGTHYTVSYSNNINAGTATVTVTGKGYYAGQTSSKTFTIKRASGAAVDTPTLKTKTDDTITVNPVSAPSNGQTVYYAISTLDSINSNSLVIWGNSTTFSNRNGDTQYYIFAKAMGNTNYSDGPISSGLPVKTNESIGSVTVDYFWVNERDTLVTTSGNATSISSGGTLTITAADSSYTVSMWTLNGVDTGQSGNTYSFSSAALGTHIIGLFVVKDGKPYNANISITVTIPRSITINMYDSGGDGWDGNGALRINVNGVDIAGNVKVQTTAANNTPGGQRNSNTYTFNAMIGDVVKVYWVAGAYQNENSFIIYYTDTPPSPTFTTSNNNNWNGTNALLYRLRTSTTTGTVSNTLQGFTNGTLLGSFTVQ